MVAIKVLYFAHLADRTGLREETVELNDGGTVVELKSVLRNRHPRLLGALDSCRVAIDEEFASDDVVLQDGRTVAFIPPVSGG
ncbi:MAG: molybdopterin converting factor subunit 1 [Planctomycetes bacterium]|nr:molybdopterin converting factor subunit 1 [Planctomycetota bacterium]